MSQIFTNNKLKQMFLPLLSGKHLLSKPYCKPHVQNKLIAFSIYFCISPHCSPSHPHRWETLPIYPNHLGWLGLHWKKSRAGKATNWQDTTAVEQLSQKGNDFYHSLSLAGSPCRDDHHMENVVSKTHLDCDTKYNHLYR